MNVYERAIEILKERGWVQNDFRAADGRRCLVAAIHDAAILERMVPEGQASAAREHVEDKIQVLYPGRRGTCLGFNDDPSTTVEDVLLVLKHAAAEA